MGAQQIKTEKDIKLPAPIRWLRATIAIISWIAVLTQILVFDIEYFLASRYPSIKPILQFRFLIFLGAIGILWLALGNRRFIVFFGYIIFYPFILVLWIAPRMLFQNWPVLIVLYPVIHSIFIKFKSNFIFFTIAFISSFIVCFASNKALIYTCMIVIATYLANHFLQRFRSAFSHSTVFSNVADAIRNLWNQMQASAPMQFPTDLDRESKEYKDKFGQNLLALYAITTAFYFVGERIRDVTKSRKIDVYFIYLFAYTFILTLFIFSLEYFGLERVMPGSFVGVANFGLFDFVGLSISTFMNSGISPIKPSNGIAQIALYSESLSSILIVILFVFVFFTSLRERYKQDLDSVVNEIGTASRNLGELLEKNSELTIAAVETLLLEFSPTAARWLLKLRHGEVRAQEMYELKGAAKDDH